MAIINKFVQAGFCYELSTVQREWASETFQLPPQVFQLGVKCVQPFPRYEGKRHSYSIKWVLNESTGIQEAVAINGEVEEHEAVFELPLMRYQGKYVRSIRISREQLDKLEKQAAMRVPTKADSTRTEGGTGRSAQPTKEKKVKEKIDLSFLGI